jgi:hypothetical protein
MLASEIEQSNSWNYLKEGFVACHLRGKIIAL